MPKPTPQMSPGRELAIVVAIAVGTGWLAARYELNERVFALTRRWEVVQLDEWPIVVFVVALCFAVLFWRRYRQAVAQLRARQAAEAQLAAALAENRQLGHQHVRMQESEHKHLARELHDELGQYLNAIKLDAVALGDSREVSGANTEAAAGRIVMAVDHVHGVVSDMIRRLRPVGLDELGLAAALDACVSGWRQRLPETRFSLSAGGQLDDLDELTNLTIFRLVQEALTNAYKHAGATEIDIALHRHASRSGSDELVLTFSDNGCGMDPQQRSGGFGLRGMRERVEMMGGEFTVDTSPDKGFSFEARLPGPGCGS